MRPKTLVFGESKALWQWLLWSSLIAGVCWRLVMYLNPNNPMWMDETSWALQTVEIRGHPWDSFHTIRSVGYLWLSYAVTKFFPHEYTFRAVSLLSSLLSLPLIWFCSRKLPLSSATRCLVVFLASLSYWSAEYAAEFKPYSMEFFLHLALVYLAIRAAADMRAFWIALTAAVLCFPFAYNLIFLEPGLFLYFYLHATSKEQKRKILLSSLCVLIAHAAFLIFCVGAYVSGKSDYWEQRYSIFLSVNEWYWFPVWYSQRLFEQLSKALLGHTVRHPQEYAFAIIGTVFTLWGVVRLWTRQRALFVLLLSVPIAMACANFVRAWPAGDFRTNVFVTPYFILLFALGVQAGLEQVRGWFGKTLLVSSLLLFCGVHLSQFGVLERPFEKTHPRLPVLDALEYLRTVPSEDVVFIPYESYSPIWFMATVHATSKRLYLEQVPFMFPYENPIGWDLIPKSREFNIHFLSLRRDMERFFSWAAAHGIEIIERKDFMGEGIHELAVLRLKVPGKKMDFSFVPGAVALDPNPK